jgi:hypothetical protein
MVSPPNVYHNHHNSHNHHTTTTMTVVIVVIVVMIVTVVVVVIHLWYPVGLLTPHPLALDQFSSRDQLRDFSANVAFIPAKM